VKIAEALQGVNRLFLDTAPIIYYIEKNPLVFDRVAPIFVQLEAGMISAVTSPVTLAECLVGPIRSNNLEYRQAFVDAVVYGRHTQFVEIDQQVAEEAAQLRVRYKLPLPDALQVAVAIVARCEAFLTNDEKLTRVNELRVVVVEDLEPEVDNP
jgi:predicted nucleic acid-binding protein